MCDIGITVIYPAKTCMILDPSALFNPFLPEFNPLFSKLTSKASMSMNDISFERS